MARLTPFLLFFAAIAFSASCAFASPLRTKSEISWIEEIEQEAIESGISSDIVHEALDDFKPNRRILELYRKQPEKTISFETYRRNIITPARVKKGAELMQLYASELKAIETRTGVSPEIVIALWAVESSFGQNIGTFSVVDALATLTFEGRRATFFKRQLFDALRILERERMPPDELRGSWAGAMGQCQFMPSIYLRYAVDEDKDGKRDIWDSPLDSLASIATYLAAEGWKRNGAWGRELKGVELYSYDNDLEKAFSSKEWEPKDIAPISEYPLSQRASQAPLIQPDGEDGPGFLVYDNFHALMRWNRSTYFALSVGLLADKIKAY